MYTLSHAVEVNPAGVTPELTAEQVWAGLELKAANALPFVPIMKRCDVIERTDKTILREIQIGDDVHREFITLHKPVQVQFERVGEGGFIQNTISNSDLGLLLSFTFSISFPGVPEGSLEEQEKGEAMQGHYVGAVSSTLKRVRELVVAGEL